MKRLAACGGLLLTLTLAGLWLHRPGAIPLPSPRSVQIFVALATVAGGIYLLAVREVLRRPPPPGAIWLVLAFALAMRACALPAPPFLSSDVFRYVWDGTVQDAGINPYRHVPADPALAALRDKAIFPHVNRAGYARTIYPPFAQVVFAAVARISPTVLTMKAAMVAFELLAIACMIRLLDSAQLPRARVLIYAWNPLAVWSFAGNGHVDAIAIGLVAAALLACAARRAGLAGALLGAAVLVKFLPAVVAPALWRRRDWRMPAACLAVIAALYLGYIGAGWHVLGFLPGYAAEEGIGRGNGFWFVSGLGEIVRITPALIVLYVLFACVALAGLAGRLGLRPDPADPAQGAIATCRTAAIMAAAVTVALSPHYAWYYAWLALPCCVAPLRSVIWLSVSGLLLYLDPFHERFLWPSLVFAPAIVLAVLDVRAHRSGPSPAPGGTAVRRLA